MKNPLALLLLVIFLLGPAPMLLGSGHPAGTPGGARAGQDSSAVLTNKDVVDMLKGGLSADIVVAKIKSSKCNFDTSPAALQALKGASVPDSVILEMLRAPAPGGETAPVKASTSRVTDELTVQFKRFQNSVVTVWSEFGHGTGFIVDPAGLVLTNQHVIGPSEYITVQFDEKRRLPATLLAQDPEKDIAVLWIQLSPLPEAVIAPIAQPQNGEPLVVEGERVFTIGSPLTQQKILTTGVVSKVEARAIISDININPGNSGGPLFSSQGFVAGMTTFHTGGKVGAGLSGIIRIEEVAPLLTEARNKMATIAPPPATLLPVEPTDTFPLDAIKAALSTGKLDQRPYLFLDGDYSVAIITPIFKYYIQEGSEVRAEKEKEKRNKASKGAAQDTFRPLEDMKNWAEYAGEYKPVLQIQATPKIRVTQKSLWARSLAPGMPLRLKFKTDFYKMRLMCGDREIQPILPGKVAEVSDLRTGFVQLTDATYQGLYTYPPGAISPACGKVILELYSEKNPNEKPTVKDLGQKTVERIWEDFAPYRDAHHSTPELASPTDNSAAGPTAPEAPKNRPPGQ